MPRKTKIIFFYTLPVVVMIALIPFIKNDYLLTIIYLLFIIVLLSSKKEQNDFAALLFGFVAITISELFFVSTGVEKFARHSLFGLIPFWLPFLWAYAFVSIKRCLKVLDQ